MSLATITPAHRLAAVARQHDLNYWHAVHASGRGGYPLSPMQEMERHAIQNARYWESFSDSYTPQQQRAAVRLLLAISDPTIDREDDEYVAAIRGVAALIGAER